MATSLYKCVDNADDELIVTEFFGGALGEDECVDDTIFLDIISEDCTAICLEHKGAEKLAHQLLTFANKARSRTDAKGNI